ncbi:hypothetical protein F383_37141 [Gossypium arboreum]|uniref:Uncharacterized protein n=1 Tax=Gossypium arboreum TaxID=29729 RepID=A0A0B0MB57_GOSAR|nr:hypothetical protein F383_37141 [Gossypium arboreum]
MIEPPEEYGCMKDLARTAWTGNPTVRYKVHGSVY